MLLAHNCFRGRQRTLAEVARLAGYSASYVTHRFRQVYGMTPLAWVRRERMRLAARLLSDHADAPIADIAARCGYRSQSLFGRHFRNAHGRTPRDFRHGQALRAVEFGSHLPG